MLGKIRQNWFKFLRTSKNVKYGIQLVKCDRLARLKLNGGWGLNNMFNFKLDISVKSLWRCLIGLGMWSIQMKDKYLKGKLGMNGLH